MLRFHPSILPIVHIHRLTANLTGQPGMVLMEVVMLVTKLMVDLVFRLVVRLVVSWL